MARSSGDTLSLKNLGTAVRTTDTGSGVSLNACNNSAGTQISLDDFGIDWVGSTIGGYTYIVESTSETYDLVFNSAGTAFNTHIRTEPLNFTWTVDPSYNSNASSAGYLSIESSPDYTAVITAGAMNPQGAGSQTALSSTTSHTLSATFADGFNDHADRYNTAITKTVYSVDTYDGNTTLCLTSDSPILKADGTIVEVGELEEGDVLSGYALGGLSQDEYSEDFYEWSTDSLEATPKDVTVVNVVYSFAQRYYSINDGELTATGEHPFLVKDVVSGDYKFKQTIQIENGDKLIKKGTSGIEEIEVTSKEVITETTEIVSIDVEEQDTYLANGYITHNKGGDSAHTDLAASSAPTGLSYSSPSISWTAPSSTGDTGITAYDFQISTASNFSSYEANVTEWSTTTAEVIVGYSLSPGTTYYLRVRAIDHGLKSDWSSTFTFTA